MDRNSDKDMIKVYVKTYPSTQAGFLTAEGHADLGEAGYRLCRGVRVRMERPNPSNHVRVAGSGV